MPDDAFPESLLTGLIASHVDADAGALGVTPCLTGKFNTTYFVDGAAQPLVLRIAPPDDRSRMLFYEHRMMRQEPEIHAQVQARTSVPVPTILACDTSHENIDRDYLLMSRLPGTPISNHAGLSGQGLANILCNVGRSLRQVHAIGGERFGYVGPHEPMTPQADWPGAFTIMWNLLVDDIENCDGYRPEEAADMRRLLDRHIKRFDRPTTASLLHMDVWAQNILADRDGAFSGLVDWDRGLWGDPEIEFAVLDYCGISEPSFWEGYGLPRERSVDSEIRRVFYLLYEVQKYIVIRRVRNRDPVRADDYRRQSLEMAMSLDR